MHTSKMACPKTPVVIHQHWVTFTPPPTSSIKLCSLPLLVIITMVKQSSFIIREWYDYAYTCALSRKSMRNLHAAKCSGVASSGVRSKMAEFPRRETMYCVVSMCVC